MATEKKTETFSIKIPESLKDRLDDLPESSKFELRNKLIYEMKLAIYMSEFDPRKYDEGN